MKKIFQALAFIAAGVAAGAILHECKGPGTSGLRPQHSGGVEALPYYDTIPYFDTIPYHLPFAKQEVSLGTKITFVPVFSPGTKPAYSCQDSTGSLGKLPSMAPEGAAVRMTAPHDSVWVEIPVTQREYEGEEYHAWVSGYEPRLDSISVYARRDVVTIRQPPDRQKRWGVGVFAGYGITPQGLRPCAGISINYNLWNF